MEGIGAEVSQKIRSAIKAKFKEIGLHVDEELPDYVMVMVANKRSKEQMDEDLQLFLGKHTSIFTTWLHQVLQKLQEVTVAKLGGVKRKSVDEPKKKKKSKQDLEKKEIKKKIKEEPDDKDNLPKAKKSRQESKDDSDSDISKGSQTREAKSNKKHKSVSKTSPDQSKDVNNISKSKMQIEDSCDSSQNDRQEKTDGPSEGRSKSLSISSQVEDLDDEDCINIRTDGELLDTAEDLNVEESSKKARDTEDSNSKSNLAQRDEHQSSQHSPAKTKDKSKSSDHVEPDRISAKEKPSSPKKRSPSPLKSPPKTDDKVVDARELLNRKKAAKQVDGRTRSRSRSRDRDRSLSPVRKRREDERESRSYREERGSHRRMREEEREANRKHSREDERDRRGPRDRESHTTKRRDEWPRKLESDKIELKNKDRRRESSAEPPPKRVMLDRTYRNKNDDWGTGRSARSTEGRKVGAESPKRKDAEDGVRRPGLVSRVVPRIQEPEEEIDVPSGVNSVVKITPRPKRPPSQQPSTSLIMRAISEANKSLANVPPRPDSTQEDGSDAVSHSDAAKALNTVIRYVKQTDKSSPDLKIFLKWRKKALSTISDS